MRITCVGVYEGDRVLKLDEPLRLAAGTRVRVLVDDPTTPPEKDVLDELTEAMTLTPQEREQIEADFRDARSPARNKRFDRLVGAGDPALGHDSDAVLADMRGREMLAGDKPDDVV